LKGKHQQAQLKFQLYEKFKISFCTSAVKQSNTLTAPLYYEQWRSGIKFLICSDCCAKFPSLDKEGLGVVGPGNPTLLRQTFYYQFFWTVKVERFLVNK